jgi:hypothetical protein
MIRIRLDPQVLANAKQTSLSRPSNICLLIIMHSYFNAISFAQAYVKELSLRLYIKYANN